MQGPDEFPQDEFPQDESLESLEEDFSFLPANLMADESDVREDSLFEFIKDGHTGDAQSLIQDMPLWRTLADNRGDSLLHVSILQGNGLSVRWLMDSHFPPNTPNRLGQHPIHCAIAHRQLDTVRTFCERADFNPDASDLEGRTALHYAVKYLPDAIPLLIAKGVNQNVMDSNGLTPEAYKASIAEPAQRSPLHQPYVLQQELPAIQDGGTINHYFKRIMDCLEQSTMPSIEEARRLFASIPQHIKSYVALGKSVEGNTLYQKIAQVSQSSLNIPSIQINQILAQFACELISAIPSPQDRQWIINEQNAHLLPPVFMAAKNRNLLLTNVFLKNKANANVTYQNEMGQDCPLMFLILEHLSEEIFELFIDYSNIYLNKPNPADGNTLAHWAVTKKLSAHLQLMVKHNEVNRNSTNLQGETPLTIASSQGDYDSIQVLLQSKANVNATSASGKNILEENVLKGALQSVQLICIAKPMKNQINEQGYGVVHLAAMMGCEGLLGILKEEGFDLNLRTKDGKTIKQLISLSAHDHIRAVLEQAEPSSSAASSTATFTSDSALAASPAPAIPVAGIVLPPLSLSPTPHESGARVAHISSPVYRPSLRALEPVQQFMVPEFQYMHQPVRQQQPMQPQPMQYVPLQPQPMQYVPMQPQHMQHVPMQLPFLHPAPQNIQPQRSNFRGPYSRPRTWQDYLPSGGHRVRAFDERKEPRPQDMPRSHYGHRGGY